MHGENSAKATGWTEERVREFLQEYPESYQNIKLPYGLETGGGDREPTLAQIFPPDMSGKSVLDIGSASGFFCLEAMKRGAARAKGFEIDSKIVRQAQLLAECLGLDVEYVREDIDTADVSEEFDYVICLNILHHLKNPFSALEKLIEMTREKLIIEIATLGRRDRRKLGVGRIQALFLNKAPVIFADRHGRGRTGQKYFISPKALQNMLLTHRRVFANVTIEKSQHKDRFIVIAEKRRIRRMLLVAGPTSVGKTTFIEKLQNGELPEVEKALGMGSFKGWTSETAGSLIHKKEATMDSMIFHYDFMKVNFFSDRIPSRDPLLDPVACADELVIVTLKADGKTLLDRLHTSEIEPKTVNGRFRGNKRHAAIREIYQEPDGVKRHYASWLDFVNTKKASGHFVVDTSRDYELATIGEWESTNGPLAG